MFTKLSFYSLLIVITVQAQTNDLHLNYNPLLYDITGLESKMKNTMVFQQEIVDKEKKSVGKALLFSLIIPGAGEYYAEQPGYAQVFFGLEVLGWASIFLNNKLFSSLENDYQNFAVLHAGVQRGNKADKYWGDIGKFDDIYSYNIQRYRDRALNEAYNENNIYHWDWDSRENRLIYDNKRLDAAVVRDREIFFVTAVFINHLVSAINAVRLVRRYNKNIAQTSINYHLVLETHDHSNKYIGLLFTKSF
jgi:hypothetical protein